MKKLLQLLTLLVCVLCGSHYAVAYDLPGTAYISYGIDSNDWTWNNQMTKDASGNFSFTVNNVNSNLYFFIHEKSISDANWNNMVESKDNIYTTGDANSGDNYALTGDVKVYQYGTCKHCFQISANGSIKVTFYKNSSNELHLKYEVGSAAHTYKIKTNLISETFYTLNDANNYTFTHTFTGTESDIYMGMDIDNGMWRGATDAGEYNGTSRTYTMTATQNGNITFAANLQGEVTFVFNPSNNQLSVSGGTIGGNDPTPSTDPIYLIGDNFSANHWTNSLKSNFDPKNADQLTFNDEYGYYIFTAQGKLGMSRQKADWDNGWKGHSLKVGDWTKTSDNIYQADITAVNYQSDFYQPSDFNSASYVYYRISSDQTKIECTTDITKFGGTIESGGNEGGGEIVIGKGIQYYLMGNFSETPYTPYILMPLNDGSFVTVVYCTNSADPEWKDMIIYSEDPDHLDEDGNPVRRYYGSNGAALRLSNDYVFNATNTADNYITLSGFKVYGKDKDNNDVLQGYTVYFKPSDLDRPNGYVRVSENEIAEHRSYYLSGDINVWSDVENRNTENESDNNKRHGFFVGETYDNTDYHYLQDDPDNPWVRFKSKEEMENYWRFQFVGYGPNGEQGNWYRLNLKARGAADLNENLGRLGGQFKIIHKSLQTNSTSFGVDAGSNPEYWKKNIKIGEVFTGVKEGARNFMLDNTVIENAEIWFLAPPDNADKGAQCSVVVLGDPHDLYVYYANDNIPENELETFKGPKVYLNTSSQANNYPHTDPFREYDNNGGAVSPKEEGFYDYSWEKLEGGADYFPYGEDGLKIPYNNVWRKKIPNSINHRSPMPFLTSVTPYEAYKKGENKWFPRVQIDCDDIWFIENGTKPINVFFRYADEGLQNSDNTQVYFNAWLDQYDESGSLAAPLYLLSDMNQDGKMTLIDKNSEYWDLVDKKYRDNGLEGDAYKEYTWFMAPQEKITTDMANAGHAMFITSYGTQYPSGLAGSSLGDRQTVALNGADLYFVVGGSSSRVGILYSHLNGTVAEDDNVETIQIGAEFFARDHAVYRNGDLNTTIGTEVYYQFSVIDKTGAELLAEEWFNEPYYNWDVKGIKEGLYRVKVRVRNLVNGKYEYYSATDIYTIYPKRNNSSSSN